MLRGVTVGIVLALLLLPGVAAGTPEDPDFEDPEGDQAAAAPATETADILAGWWQAYNETHVELVVKLASVDASVPVKLDVAWTVFYALDPGQPMMHAGASYAGGPDEALWTQWIQGAQDGAPVVTFPAAGAVDAGSPGLVRILLDTALAGAHWMMYWTDVRAATSAAPPSAESPLPPPVPVPLVPPHAPFDEAGGADVVVVPTFVNPVPVEVFDPPATPPNATDPLGDSERDAMDITALWMDFGPELAYLTVHVANATVGEPCLATVVASVQDSYHGLSMGFTIQAFAADEGFYVWTSSSSLADQGNSTRSDYSQQPLGVVEADNGVFLRFQFPRDNWTGLTDFGRLGADVLAMCQGPDTASSWNDRLLVHRVTFRSLFTPGFDALVMVIALAAAVFVARRR